MKKRLLLAAILLGGVFCFLVSGVGNGAVIKWMIKQEASFLEMSLLNARITYMMINLDSYQNVGFVHDPNGEFGKTVFPKGVNTKNKIIVRVEDIRGDFINKSREDLLILFWVELMSISSVLEGAAITDMDTDIVAIFYNKEGIPLAYFYQGEYYLWGVNNG